MKLKMSIERKVLRKLRKIILIFISFAAISIIKDFKVTLYYMTELQIDRTLYYMTELQIDRN